MRLGPTAQIVLQAGTIVMALYGTFVALDATWSLVKAIDDFQSVIDNWTTAPVTEIYTEIAANAQSICLGSGGSPISVPRFPRTLSKACACPHGARHNGRTFVSDASKSCDTNATKAGCLWELETMHGFH